MKRIFTLLAAVIFTANVFAQAPQKMSYQAVVRNSSDKLVTSASVGMRISILKGSATGSAVYVETQTPTTNANGLVTIEIGGGTIVSGKFDAINWAAGSYFIKTETDPTGGINYTITGTSQLLSVPYALYANAANEQDTTIWKKNSKNIYYNSGKVGIGTTSPNGQFEVIGKHDTSVPADSVRTQFGIGGRNFDLWYKSLDNGGYHITSLNNENGYTEFRAGSAATDSSTMIMHLQNNGNVGIATDSPSEKLEVNGTVKATSFVGDGSKLTGINNQNAATKTYADSVSSLFYISGIGDTLFLGHGKYIIINGISSNNPNGIGIKVTNGIDLTDIDGNIYHSVIIGTQTWMAENLKVTHYRNGELIPNVTDSTIWSNLTTGARCYYNNDSATYASTYGTLYNWYTVNTGNLCPTGWHVPTDAEWTTQATYLGGDSIAGGKLKEVGTTHWNSPNTGADNSSGFLALPAGRRGGYDGVFAEIGRYGIWWSATEGNPLSAYDHVMLYNKASSSSNQSDVYVRSGYSVRCLRDK